MLQQTKEIEEEAKKYIEITGGKCHSVPMGWEEGFRKPPEDFNHEGLGL